MSLVSHDTVEKSIVSIISKITRCTLSNKVFKDPYTLIIANLKTVHMLMYQQQFSYVMYNMFVVSVSTVNLWQRAYYCAKPVCYVVFI